MSVCIGCLQDSPEGEPCSRCRPDLCLPDLRDRCDVTPPAPGRPWRFFFAIALLSLGAIAIPLAVLRPLPKEPVTIESGQNVGTRASNLVSIGSVGTSAFFPNASPDLRIQGSFSWSQTTTCRPWFQVKLAGYPEIDGKPAPQTTCPRCQRTLVFPEGDRLSGKIELEDRSGIFFSGCMICLREAIEAGRSKASFGVGLPFVAFEGAVYVYREGAWHEVSPK